MKRIIALALLSAVGCAGVDTRSAMQTWMGHHKDELFVRWGPPTQVMTNGEKGEIWTYVYQHNWQSPSYTFGGNQGSTTYIGNTSYTSGTGNTFTVPGQMNTAVKTYSFWISKDGLVTYWSYRE